eukprot:Skav204479  [mRNA]  locus=scaffold5533:170330:178429:- [translate_table: standard]
MFVALVPSDRHSDTGLPCNFSSWLQRGWCRTELWCHVLSARSKHPFVVVRSHDSAQYTAPLWHRYPVHLGDFTMKKDRARCCQVIQTALANHVSQLRQSKSKTAYRLYLSLFEEMAGLEPKCRTVQDFLQEFSFSTVAGQQRGSSLSPVSCAALSGDCRLVRALVAARASLQSHAPAMPEVLHFPSLTPLHLALWFKSHDLQMLETLLDLRADPNSSGIAFPPPVGYCRSVGAMDLLVQRGAGVNICGAYILKYLPIHILAGFGAPCEVVARAIEVKADVRGGCRGMASTSPLHVLADAGDSENTLKTAQLLLESRANIDQLCQPEGIICRSIELTFRARSQCCSLQGIEAGALVRFSRDISTTPLGWSVLMENEGLLTFLLRARADPEIRNNRGLRPIDFARKLKIQWDVVTEFHGGVLLEVEVQRLHMAHVWLDYFSIPQLVGDGPIPHLEENQLKYIEAIPAFVGRCDVFVALVPSDRRSDTGLHCNFSSWLQRGWCRTELWCHVLSARSNHPIVVVRSHDSAQYTAPLWHRYPVHLGDFTIEEDRARCCQVVQTGLANHVSQLRQSKSKTAYRLYLSLFEEMAGLEPKCRTVQDFLQEFSFSTVAGQQRGSSLSPVSCAALSGDCRLVRALVAARASLQSHAPAMPEVLHFPSLTPLHLALWFKSHDLQMLETLLDLRADPNSSGIAFPPPLGFCRSVGAVDLLVQRGAGVNSCGSSILKYLPIHILAGFGAPCEVVARIIELQADVRGGRGGLASASPLHPLADPGDSENALKTAQLLLESRANIDQVCQLEGIICRSIELTFRARSQICSLQGIEAGAIMRFSRDISTTPLGWCALLENEGLLTFLLHARADPEIRNNRGLRPIDFARSDRIRTILKDPTESMYLLEHDSELVTWEC